MENKRCPWCGSGQNHDCCSSGHSQWLCGSFRAIEYGTVRSETCEMQDKLARMQPVIDALGTYITSIRGPAAQDVDAVPTSWYAVADAWDKYMEAKR